MGIDSSACKYLVLNWLSESFRLSKDRRYCLCNVFFVGLCFQAPLTLLELTSRRLESLLEGQDPDINSGGINFNLNCCIQTGLSSVDYNCA